MINIKTTIALLVLSVCFFAPAPANAGLPAGWTETCEGGKKTYRDGNGNWIQGQKGTC